MTTTRGRCGPRSLALALLTMAALSKAQPAAAALGDDLASIQGDQARMKGTLRTTAMAGYLLHEIQVPTGTVVREFSSPAGSVFAVSWEGRFLPDLHGLLGASYEPYVQAARMKRRGRGPLLIRLPGLVFESSGHPRGFHGRAYIPRLLPEGVPPEAIR